MTLDNVIINQCFNRAPVRSLQIFGDEFFRDLAVVFEYKLDSPIIDHKAIRAILKSYIGQAFWRAYYQCKHDDPKDALYNHLHTEEVYILCHIIGIGFQRNRNIAIVSLLNKLKEVKEGAKIELIKLPSNRLVERLDMRYYGKEKIQPKRGTSKLQA